MSTKEKGVLIACLKKEMTDNEYRTNYTGKLATISMVGNHHRKLTDSKNGILCDMDEDGEWDVEMVTFLFLERIEVTICTLMAAICFKEFRYSSNSSRAIP
ncbi:hypothetical protein RF11_05316 [Thelohanellus kitauei]|uniref:Uncharacterized protein n=1 Tax=Thelohanellus kitauei TaxID=669202 RepID=A0A0C2IJL2_THEKT|nr:hypothetical protein RF11_05316 [Thelohanellus kitauei]